MIAVDTSAIIAIAMAEPEGTIFDELIVERQAVIGAPTLFETRMVLGTLMPSFADAFMDQLLSKPSVQAVDFTLASYGVAVDAFHRYGKGRGHPAQLNFGDCLSYAVARSRNLPLLFKGDDFARTDLVPAYDPAL